MTVSISSWPTCGDGDNDDDDGGDGGGDDHVDPDGDDDNDVHNPVISILFTPGGT